MAVEHELIILIRAHGNTKDRCTVLARKNYVNHYNRVGRYQNFLATIHLQSFTFKESLGRHHCLQIDNDLLSTLESENL